MADNLNNYARDLDAALSSGTRYAAHNRDLAHAEVVVCTALEHAKDEVLLLSNRLDPMLYDGMWFNFAMTLFLKNGGKVRILVEQDLGEDHPVRLAGWDAGISIRRMRPEWVRMYGFNFMLVDDVGYRFETSRKEPQAVVVFRGKDEEPDDTFTRLKATFEMFWEHAAEVDG